MVHAFGCSRPKGDEPNIAGWITDMLKATKSLQLKDLHFSKLNHNARKAVTEPSASGIPNDAIRTTLAEGKCAVSAGVAEVGLPFATAAAAAARAYRDFKPDNDPDGEHDLGAFTIEDQRLV